MNFKISGGQTLVLADFCKDLAKGIALGIILGQGVGNERSLALTLVWTSLAIMFLLFALEK